MADRGNHTWICYLARLGYASRGLVYLLVGGLAATAAFVGGGETGGTKSALATIANEWWGKALLAVIGVGLLAYAIWRFVQAYHDVDDEGRDAKGVVSRVGMVVSGVANLILGAWVFTALLSGNGGGGGNGGDGGENSRYAWTAWGLQQPGGRWIVGLVGLIIAGVGVKHLVKGYKAKFEEHLTFDYQRWPWAKPLCRFGLIARGVVFCIIGWFFVQAAIDYSPGEAGGVGKVFETLRAQPWGWLILGIVALGMAAFGIYSFVEAAYRRIDAPDEIVSKPG